MDFYNALIAERENATVEVKRLDDGRTQTTSGTGEAIVSAIYIEDDQGNKIDHIDVGQNIKLCIEVDVKKEIPRLILGYSIKDRLGQVIYGTNTDLKSQELVNVSSKTKLRYRIEFSANLGVGHYSIQTALCSTETHLVNNYEWRDLALIFNVINVSKPYFAGCAWIDPLITIEEI